MIDFYFNIETITNVVRLKTSSECDVENRRGYDSAVQRVFISPIFDDTRRLNKN